MRRSESVAKSRKSSSALQPDVKTKVRSEVFEVIVERKLVINLSVESNGRLVRLRQPVKPFSAGTPIEMKKENVFEARQLVPRMTRPLPLISQEEARPLPLISQEEARPLPLISQEED